MMNTIFDPEAFSDDWQEQQEIMRENAREQAEMQAFSDACWQDTINSMESEA